MTSQVQPAGRWFRTREGYSTFIPNRLPPALTWTPPLLERFPMLTARWAAWPEKPVVCRTHIF